MNFVRIFRQTKESKIKNKKNSSSHKLSVLYQLHFQISELCMRE